MPDRHERIRDIFIAAVELPESRRAAYLEEACGDDYRLRAEVEKLIGADKSTETYLRPPERESATRFSLGHVLAGRFRVVRFIAGGGMGDVYEAEDLELHERVALKTIRPEMISNANALARFKREIQYAKRVTHPNVCRIHDFGSYREGEREIVFLTMELVEGETLAARLGRGPIGAEEALELVTQIAGALTAAHQAGIIHRDLKPSNVILAGAKAVVTDFGLARPAAPTEDASLTEAGKVVGTPAYMAPEQIANGEMTPATDLYALGLVMYEMVTGRRAFPGNGARENPVPLVPNLDARWSRVIRRCLERDPARRYQSAAEVVGELSGARRRPARIPRYWLVAAAAFAAIAAAAVFAPVFLFAPKPGPEAARWYQEGINALRDGTYYKASQALERAASLAPRYALAHAHLAEAWLELDYQDRAREEMLRANPPGAHLKLSSAEESTLEAIHLTMTGDYTGAVRKYREILDRASAGEAADAYVDLGRAYEKNEKLKEALEDYREAARRSPQFAAAFLRSGVLYARSQDAGDARTAFDQAETLYRALSNMEGVTEVMYQRAVAATNAGHPTEAVELAEQAIAIARTAGNVNQQVTALMTLSYARYNLGDPAKGQASAMEALELARSNGLENLTTRGLVQVGNAAMIRGEPEQAAKYFRESLTYARRYQSTRNEMRAALSLASALIQEGHAEECIQALQPAIEFYKNGGYRVETVQALLILNRARVAQGDYQGALQAATEPLAIAQQLKNGRLIALAEDATARALSSLQRYPEALTHFEQDLAAAQATGDKGGIAFAQLNIGTQLAQLGRYQAAAEALQHVLDSSGAGNASLAAEAHLELARMNLSRLKLADATKEAGLALAPSGNGRQMEADCVLALAASIGGHSKEARRQAQEALKLAEEPESEMGDALLAAAAVRLASGDRDEALDAALRAQQIFSQRHQPESEWRAWLLCARAAKGPKAKDYAASAKAVMGAIEKTWPAQDYQSYLARPDVQIYRKQLDQF